MVTKTCSQNFIPNAAVKFKMAEVLPSWGSLRLLGGNCFFLSPLFDLNLVLRNPPKKKSFFPWEKRDLKTETYNRWGMRTEKPDDWTDRWKEAKRRWLAPGVRSHRWARRPSASGGVLEDRAWRSLCACVCVRVWRCQSLLKHICRSRRNTGPRARIHMFPDHLVTASKPKAAKQVISTTVKSNFADGVLTALSGCCLCLSLKCQTEEEAEKGKDVFFCCRAICKIRPAFLQWCWAPVLLFLIGWSASCHQRARPCVSAEVREEEWNLRCQGRPVPADPAAVRAWWSSGTSLTKAPESQLPRGLQGGRFCVYLCVCVTPNDPDPLSISPEQVARWGCYEAHPKSLSSSTHIHTHTWPCKQTEFEERRFNDGK